jgi:hypothetical protein
VPVDLDRIYSDPDPAYVCWVRALLAEVEDIKTSLNAQP